MNVSSAKRNIPKDNKSLKLKLFFMSITSILCRMKVNHPVTRLPAAIKLLKLLYHKTTPNTSSKILLLTIFQSIPEVAAVDWVDRMTQFRRRLSWLDATQLFFRFLFLSASDPPSQITKNMFPILSI